LSEKTLRLSVLAHRERLAAAGFGGPFTTDISVRSAASILITPEGHPAPHRPALIARMPLAGEYGAWRGPLKPSAEWRLHLDIARGRPDVGAILRFQSPYATALAMTHKSIPAAHPAVALFGASEIRCSKYAPAGTKELAVLALEALGDGHAALLGNFGALTTGATLEAAFARAVELEWLARLYAIALSVGRPAILADDEMARIRDRLKAGGADIEARIAPPRAKAKAASKRPAKAAPRKRRP
jgi:L-fuculose-phosphate aldolase